MPKLTDIDLFPLSPADLEFSQSLLNKFLGSGKATITSLGTFQILEEKSWSEVMRLTGGPRVFWSPELLGLDYKDPELTINKAGRILILEEGKRIVGSVIPDRLRIIDPPKAYQQIVGGSGYLLPAHLKLSSPLSLIQLEEQLVFAEKRIEPTDRFGSERYFAIKVDPSLSGKNVWRLDFKFLHPDPEWVKDGVIIDPETKKLIARKIYHPFASHRRFD